MKTTFLALCLQLAYYQRYFWLMRSQKQVSQIGHSKHLIGRDDPNWVEDTNKSPL